MKHCKKFILIFFVVSFLCGEMTIFTPVVGAQFTPVKIRDKKGSQVGIYKESHALVIGVSKYTNGWPVLEGVVSDVVAVGDALEENGFHVTAVMDPDKDELEEAFEQFIMNYGGNADNRLLFYFAGHGYTVKPKYGGNPLGYIVPKEAPNPEKSEKDLKKFKRIAMSMQRIEEYALNIDAKHAIFIFDSCFSGTIFDLSRSIPEHISYKTAKPVRQFITSGDADETVPDRSIFRRQFIAALNGEADMDRDSYVTGIELGEFLQKKVISYSNESQHPQYGKIRHPHLDKGDFVFHVRAHDLPTHPLSKGPVKSSLDLSKYEKRGEWNKALAGITANYHKLLEMDKNGFTPATMITAWKDFINDPAVMQNNQYSQKDEEMRLKANERLSFWLARERHLAGGMNKKVTFKNESNANSKEWVDTVTGMEFVFVDGGCYQMGDQFGDGYDSEKPVHEVCMDDFYIGKYEVTQGEWKSLMGDNPSRFKHGDDYPVERVSWDDAREFIKRLNKKTDGKYRLPTEAEWEFAARSGGKKEKWAGTSKESELGKYGWYDANSDKKTHPVGKKIANGIGLFDMTGNVWEWCSDWYSSDYYKKSPKDNPVGPSSGSVRVIRGGSWGSDPGGVRAAYRNGDTPGGRGGDLGFRLARTP